MGVTDILTMYDNMTMKRCLVDQLFLDQLCRGFFGDTGDVQQVKTVDYRPQCYHFSLEGIRHNLYSGQ